MVVESIRDNFAATLPSLAVFSLILLIPRAAQQSLENYRAVQAYDAQPAPGPERSVARSQLPSKKVRIVSALVAFAPLAILIFIYSTVTWDDGTRPLLSAARSAIAPILVAIIVFFTLAPFLFQTRMTALKVLYRNVDIAKNKATSATTFYHCNRQGARALLVCFALLAYVSLHVAFWATRSSSYLAEALVAAAGWLYCMRMLPLLSYALPGKSSLRSRLVLIGVLLAAAVAYIAVIALVILLIAAIMYFVDSSTDSKASGSEKSNGFWDRWGDAMDHDLPFAQMLAILPAFNWCILLPLTADLLTFAYRFDVHNADEKLVELSEEDKQEILEASSTAALQQQKASNAKHPWDSLGRFAIDMRTVRVPAAKKLAKPIFWATMITLVLVQALDMFLELCFVPSSFYVHRIPLTKAEVPDLASNPVLMHNLGPLVAYPFCLLAIVGAAWWRGGNRGLRSLWAYNETWACDYLGVPDEGKSETAGDDATATEKVANESGSEGASEALLLLSEDEERRRAENLA